MMNDNRDMREDAYDLQPHATLLDELERQEATGADSDPEKQQKPRDSSTAYLDGLRGLAALFVVIQHYVGGFDMNVHEHGFGENGNYYFASLPFVRIIFSGGSAAVAIFFVLSGYVLSIGPLKVLRAGDRDAIYPRLASAVVRRPVRLYLPPLAVTFIFAILLHAPFDLVPKSPWPPRKDGLFAELGNWVVESLKFFNPFRTHGSNQGWFTYSLVVWSIPIELKGSMLIYGLTAVDTASRAPQTLFLLALAFSVIAQLQFAYWTMACFVAGYILASMDSNSLDQKFFARSFTPRTQSFIFHGLFFVGFYLLCQPSHDGQPHYASDALGWGVLSSMVPAAYDANQYYRFWHSYGAVLSVYSTLHIKWVQSFLSTRPLKYLGKVSFLLYLVHLPVIAIFGDRIGRMLGNVPFGPDSWWDNWIPIPDIGPAAMSLRFLTCLALVLPVCLAVAHLGTIWLDEPSVKAGKKIVQKLGLGEKRGR